MRRSIFQQPHLDLYRTILTMSQPFVAEFKLHIHTLTIYQYRQEFGDIWNDVMATHACRRQQEMHRQAFRSLVPKCLA